MGDLKSIMLTFGSPSSFINTKQYQYLVYIYIFNNIAFDIRVHIAQLE